MRAGSALTSSARTACRSPRGSRIYSDAYTARLARSARGELSRDREAAGRDGFRASSRTEYIASHDSRFFSIRYYGHALAQFLATEPRYRPVPFLADLARWEWMMAEVFDAADADPIDRWRRRKASRRRNGRSMRFTFHPSVRVLALAWNAPQMWKALMDDAERPRAARVAGARVLAAVAARDEGILPPLSAAKSTPSPPRAPAKPSATSAPCSCDALPRR